MNISQERGRRRGCQWSFLGHCLSKHHFGKLLEALARKTLVIQVYFRIFNV